MIKLEFKRMIYTSYRSLTIITDIRKDETEIRDKLFMFTKILSKLSMLVNPKIGIYFEPIEFLWDVEQA